MECENNENPKLCKFCADNNKDCCCQNIPGSFVPDDIKLDVDVIAAKLTLNEWAVDYWEGDTQLYYLRPAVAFCTKYIDASWGGPCGYLQSDGCKLPFERRPTQCKSLVPKSGDRCLQPKEYEKHAVALMWVPYEDLLMKAVEIAKEQAHGM